MDIKSEPINTQDHHDQQASPLLKLIKTDVCVCMYKSSRVDGIKKEWIRYKHIYRDTLFKNEANQSAYASMSSKLIWHQIKKKNIEQIHIIFMNPDKGHASRYIYKISQHELQ